MMREEQHLRNFLRGGYNPDSIPEEKKLLSSLIRALVRACYEDAANRGNKAYMDGEVVYDAIMAAIRRKGK
jgi:hypothetical protein